jgi:hypothetical protein
MWGGSLILVITAGSGYLKKKRKRKTESKNHGFRVLDTIQNQSAPDSGFFKKFKELSSFMKEPAKAWQLSRWLFHLFKKHLRITILYRYNNQVFEFLITITIYQNRVLDFFL